MTPEALLGGFVSPPQQSSRAFRSALTALSRPGTIVTVEGGHGPAPLSPAAAVLALTLLDGTTPVHLAGAHDTAALRDWLAFHTGAPVTGAEEASFAIGVWDALQPVTRFAIGTAEYPDRAATLIVETKALTATGPRLSGPGIAGTAHLSLPEVAAFHANRRLFPLGFDCFLTAGAELAALPRSTVVEDI